MIRCSGVSGLADLDLVKKIIVVTEGWQHIDKIYEKMRPSDNSVACGKEEESPRGDHKWNCKGWQPVLKLLLYCS